MYMFVDDLNVLCVCVEFMICLFFFFKQKTAYEMRISDWSSDVCSSDLLVAIDRSAWHPRNRGRARRAPRRAANGGDAGLRAEGRERHRPGWVLRARSRD